MQTAADRMVIWVSRWRSTNSSALLRQLHWLSRRVKFKIACISYNTVSTTQPAYLFLLLKQYIPSRTLCCSVNPACLCIIFGLESMLCNVHFLGSVTAFKGSERTAQTSQNISLPSRFVWYWCLGVHSLFIRVNL